MPNWQAHRETRAMPRGGTLVRGMGGTTIDEHGQSVQTQSEVIELPDDGSRRKIIKLPNEIPNPETGQYTDNYMLKAVPLPRRYLGKIRGPKGTRVHQRWHVGGMWTPNRADRWEDYWGYVIHTL